MIFRIFINSLILFYFSNIPGDFRLPSAKSHIPTVAFTTSSNSRDRKLRHEVASGQTDGIPKKESLSPVVAPRERATSGSSVKEEKKYHAMQGRHSPRFKKAEGEGEERVEEKKKGGGPRDRSREQSHSKKNSEDTKEGREAREGKETTEETKEEARDTKEVKESINGTKEDAKEAKGDKKKEEETKDTKEAEGGKRTHEAKEDNKDAGESAKEGEEGQEASAKEATKGAKEEKGESIRESPKEGRHRDREREGTREVKEGREERSHRDKEAKESKGKDGKEREGKESKGKEKEEGTPELPRRREKRDREEGERKERSRGKEKDLVESKSKRRRETKHSICLDDYAAWRLYFERDVPLEVLKFFDLFKKFSKISLELIFTGSKKFLHNPMNFNFKADCQTKQNFDEFSFLFISHTKIFQKDSPRCKRYVGGLREAQKNSGRHHGSDHDAFVESNVGFEI
jgi:hypothetical protein